MFAKWPRAFLSPLTKEIVRINLHMSGRVIAYYSICHILWAASKGFQEKTGREFSCDVASNRSVVSAGMVREETRTALGWDMLFSSSSIFILF